MAAPHAYIYPVDGTLDMPPRDALRFEIVPADLVTLWNPFSVDITVVIGAATIPVMINGVQQNNWVFEYLPSPTDPINGVLVKTRQPGVSWAPGTAFDITFYVEDMIGNPTTVSAHIEVGDYTCVEDDLPAVTAIETRLMAGPLTTKCEKLRKSLLKVVSSSTNKQAQARTILYFANATDLGTILADWVDLTLGEGHFGDRENPLDINTKLASFLPTIRDVISELTPLSAAARTLLEDRIKYPNALYITSAIANIVTLCATLKEQGLL